MAKFFLWLIGLACFSEYVFSQDCDKYHISPAVIVSTLHNGTFNGEYVEYVAKVMRFNIEMSSGRSVDVYATSYVKTFESDPNRSVMIFFNGGPGASSSLLHFSGFGPYMLTNSHYAMNNRIVENHLSPLNAYDLVFIDPVSTGFSDANYNDEVQCFLSTRGDAMLAARIIESWRSENNRVHSPTFILGESYGTLRAIKAISLFFGNQAPISGAILIGMLGDVDPDVMSYVGALPAMAFGSYYHGVNEYDGLPANLMYEKFKSFAIGKYKSLLSTWDEMSTQQRNEIVDELAGLIGINREYIYARRGRITKTDFMLALLRNNGLRVGSLDVRAKSKIIKYFDESSPFLTDPALGVARFIKSEERIDPASIGAISNQHIRKYYQSSLGFNAGKPYSTMNFMANSRWSYDGFSSFYPILSDTLSDFSKYAKEHADFGVLIISGYYDLTTPALSAQFSMEKAKFPTDQLSYLNVAGPHAAYSESAVRREVLDEIYHFVSEYSRLDVDY